MKKTKDVQIIDAGKAESSKNPADPEVMDEFAEAQHAGVPEYKQLSRRLHASERRGHTLEFSEQDLHADPEVTPEGVGEAPVEEENTSTTDPNVVDEIGDIVGVSYEDGEPLRGAEKVEKRDRNRWDLDPASSEDYEERTHEEAPLKKMRFRRP